MLVIVSIIHEHSAFLHLPYFPEVFISEIIGNFTAAIKNINIYFVLD